MTDTNLDVRDKPPAERHQAVFEAFEEIEAGETLTVVNDHDPSPLLHELDATEPTFDAEASGVERTGSNRFEANLHKSAQAARSADEPGTTDEIRDALQTVTDPDLGMNIVDAGLVAAVEVRSDGNSGSTGVNIDIDPAGMGETALDEIEAEIEETVARETPVEEVEIRRREQSGGPAGGSVSADDVLERLADVSHPDRTDDVVESGAVRDVAVDGGTVTVSMGDPELGDDLEEYRGEFLQLVGEAAYNAHGVTRVRIDTGDAEVPIDPPRTEDPPLADAPEAGGPPGTEGPSPLAQGASRESSAPPSLDLEGIDEVILVASAKGGVGKTTVATQLARGLATSDSDVGLLDADFSGPDVPKLLGLEPRITEGSVIEPVEYDGLDVMSVGLMENRPTAWNGEMIHNALFNLLEDIDWDAGTLVVDLPPGASDTLMTFLQFVPIDGVVLVTTPHQTSLADTRDGAVLFREGDVPVLGVVVNMAGFGCPTCGDEHDLFPDADVDAALDHPVLTELPFSPDLREFTGPPPARFEALAETVSESIPTDEKPTVPEDAVDVRDLPEHGRVETVEDAFAATDSGAVLTVVSDRNPAGLAVALVDSLDVEESPSEVFEQYEVDAVDSDRWILRVQKPEGANVPGS